MSTETKFEVQYTKVKAPQQDKPKKTISCGCIAIVTTLAVFGFLLYFFLRAPEYTPTDIQPAVDNIQSAMPTTKPVLYDPSCIVDQNSEYTLVAIQTDRNGVVGDYFHLDPCPGGWGYYITLRVYDKSDHLITTISIEQPTHGVDQIRSVFFNRNNQIFILNATGRNSRSAIVSTYNTDGSLIRSSSPDMYYFDVVDHNDKCIAIKHGPGTHLSIIDTVDLDIETVIREPYPPSLETAWFANNNVRVVFRHSSGTTTQSFSVPNCF